MMNLETIARFLDDHPDFAPVLLMVEKKHDTPRVMGFDAEGTFFSLDDVEHMLDADPSEGSMI